MTTRVLEIFSAVVECGSMSAAARKLRISQSSVSQAVVDLERKYDVLLFERCAHTLRPTAVGETLLEYANKTLGLARETEEFLQNATHQVRLRVGASVTVGRSVLCPVLIRLRQQMPQITLEAVVTNTHGIEGLLVDHELDLGLVEGQVTHQELTKEHIVRDDLTLICGRGHPFFGRQIVSPDELNGQTFVLREDGSGTRAQLEQALQEHKIRYHTGWASSSSEVIQKAVISNFGLSALSLRILQDSLRQGLLWSFQVEGFQLSRDFTLVYHKDKYPAQAFSCFRQICLELAQSGEI